jgi:hypothetical protein
MALRKFLNCERLRDAFEGREAIYIEHGVLRVQVTSTRCSVGAREIGAWVDEIPTPGWQAACFTTIDPTRHFGGKPARAISPSRFPSILGEWDTAAGRSSSHQRS